MSEVSRFGVAGMVRERQKEYAPAYARLNITGTVLCILAAAPLFAAMCVSASDLFYIGAVCLLLAIVSAGCFAFVLGGVNHSAMQALLEEEDYTRENKAKSPVVGAVSGIYWLLVTAVYLFYTFGPMGNGQPKYSWFIWAVAGVLFGAVMLVVKHRKENVTAARYIEKCPFSERTDIFCVFAYRHSAQ